MDGDSRSAGDISAWLSATRATAHGLADADVACDGCTACCESSQFVHIGPDEAETLAAIPSELLFPAPGAPDGHLLMGYDEHGRCPMLVDGACSIYEARPVTCRAFDCRVFAATGVDVDPNKPLIAAAAQRWKFEVDGEYGEAQLAALRAAAAFVGRHLENERFRAAVHSPTAHAALAVEIHDAFIGVQHVDDAAVLVALNARRSPDVRNG